MHTVTEIPYLPEKIINILWWKESIYKTKADNKYGVTTESMFNRKRTNDPIDNPPHSFSKLYWAYWNENFVHVVWGHSFPLAKVQIISKWFFGVFDFLQKTNENMSTWGIIVVKSNSFVLFLEEIEDTKKPFRNYLTFKWILKGFSQTLR